MSMMDGQGKQEVSPLRKSEDNLKKVESLQRSTNPMVLPPLYNAKA